MEEESKFAYNQYRCVNCDVVLKAPEHCGKPMQVRDNNSEWICWKGDHPPCCGRDAIEIIEGCCDNQSLNAVDDGVINLV